MSDEYKPYEPISTFNIPDLVDVVNRKYEAGKYWADAVSVFNALERGLKVKEAKIRKQIRDTQNPPNGKKAWSEGDLEDECNASKDYSDYIALLDEAHNQMLIAVNERNTWEAAFDALRSKLANERELTRSLK